MKRGAALLLLVATLAACAHHQSPGPGPASGSPAASPTPAAQISPSPTLAASLTPSPSHSPGSIAPSGGPTPGGPPGPTAPPTPTPPPYTPGGTQTGVTYCLGGGAPQTMDLTFPAAASSPSPVVVFVHGGGWVGGDSYVPPDSFPGLIEQDLVSRGFLFVSINYRLAPASPWPAQIVDTKCAIRYLRANAAAYHLDPGRIAAWGQSAGGHLVSMLGTADASAGFDVGQYTEQSSVVQAVVDEYGPTDLTAGGWSPRVISIITSVFGHPPGQSTPTLLGASPVANADAGDPPFLIVQGWQDQTVPPSQSQEFYTRLRAVGVPASLVMVDNAGHSLDPSPPGAQPNPSPVVVKQSIEDFLVGAVAR